MDTSPLLDPEQQALAQALIQDLEHRRHRVCPLCTKELCFHEVLFSIVMGFKNEPQCLGCLAQEVQKTPEHFRDQIYTHIQRRPCWQRGWEWSSQQENFPVGQYPACLWDSIQNS